MCNCRSSLRSHYVAWAAIALGSAVVTVAVPSMASSMAVPFCLACTVGGYLIGNAVPSQLQVRLERLERKIVDSHPEICIVESFNDL